MFVRSITIYLVQQEALDRYVYPGTWRALGDRGAGRDHAALHRAAISGPRGIDRLGGGGLHRSGIGLERAAQSTTLALPPDMTGYASIWPAIRRSMLAARGPAERRGHRAPYSPARRRSVAPHALPPRPAPGEADSGTPCQPLLFVGREARCGVAELASASAISNALMYSWTALRYSSCASRSPTRSSGTFRPQQVRVPLGLMERDGQRLSHVGHHREVQQFRDIDFVVEPPGVGTIVRFNEFWQLSAVAFLVALRARPDASATAILACCFNRYRSSRRSARRSFAAAIALSPPPITPPSGKTSHAKIRGEM